MLLDAEETFTSIVECDYLGDHGGDEEAFYQKMNAELEDFDFSRLEKHPSVKAVGKEKTAWAFVEGETIKRNNSPLYSYSIIKISSIKKKDEHIYQGIVDEVLFGNRAKVNTYVLVNLLDEQEMSWSNQLIPGHQYLIIGKIADGRSPTLVIRPEIPGQMENIPVIIDLDENPDYLETDTGRQLLILQEALTTVNNSLPVTVVTNLEASGPFYFDELLIKAGRIFHPSEYRENNNVVLISELLADFYQVGINDTLTLKLHYSKRGIGLSDFLKDTNFAYEASYTIIGIFENKEENKHTIYMPDAGWINQKLHSSTLARYIVKNGTGEEFIENLKNSLLPSMNFTLYDQGYEEAVKPIVALKNNAILIIILGALSGTAILVLFAYLYVVKQRDTILTMLSLGTGIRRTMMYIHLGAMLLVLCASSIGAYIASRFLNKVTQKLFDAMKASYATDLRFSERKIGLQTYFIPQARVNNWLPVLVMAAILLVSLIILSVFTHFVIQKKGHVSIHRRSKKERVLMPRKTQVNKITFGRVRPIALKFALISLTRTLGRSFIIPIVSVSLSVFLIFLGLLSNKQKEELETVYEHIPVTAYMTTYKDETREVSGLDLQYDIYRLIDPECSIRSDEELYEDYLINGWYNSERANEDRRKILTNSQHFQEMYLYTTVHYEYMGISMTKEGEVNEALSWYPNIRKHNNAYGFDWFLNEIARMPKLAYADDLRYTPDFFNTSEPEVEFLEGYSYDSLLLSENIGMISQNLAVTYDIEHGDTIQITAWFEHGEDGAFCVIRFKVVGIYDEKWRSDTIYLPWIMSYDHNYGIDSLYHLDEEGFPVIYSISNEIVPRRVSAVTLALKNTEELSTLRNYLYTQGYSMVGKIRSNRRAMVIQDKALEDTIQNLRNHIRLIETIKPIMLVLFGIIGFVISYLLIKHRLQEFAIMRSMGARNRQVFFSFFLEQFLLFIVGLLPAIVYACLLPDQIIWYGSSLVYFILCYLLGSAFALMFMNRRKILDILFTKE
jgi:ABC-type antimicrobial peptide transport system permease subunit